MVLFTYSVFVDPGAGNGVEDGFANTKIEKNLRKTTAVSPRCGDDVMAPGPSSRMRQVLAAVHEGNADRETFGRKTDLVEDDPASSCQPSAQRAQDGEDLADQPPGSSADVGSSNNIQSGIHGEPRRAIATRCCCPPEERARMAVPCGSARPEARGKAVPRRGRTASHPRTAQHHHLRAHHVFRAAVIYVARD